MAESEKLDTLFSELMTQAQQGHNASYEQLLLTIAPIIRSFISRRIANKNEVDDILQNSLMAIHKASHTYNTSRSFTGWMFAITRHKVNDFLKIHYKKNETLAHSIDDENGDIDHYVSALPNSSELLSELVQTLSEPQRSIVYMLKIEGYTIQEVSRRVNMSEAAVKVAAHRAYKILISQPLKET